MIVNNKLGIVLSGGGFRGIAHLGILEYIRELDIKYDVISGASAGALLGAFIAEGYQPNEVLKIARDEKIMGYSMLSIKRGGFFNSSIFEKIIQKYIPHDSFEGLKMQLFASVTDLTNAQSLIFNHGSLSFALKASCCFPLVFQPVHYKDDIYLCDGGLMNNFPVEQVRAICNKTIGINVNPMNKMEGDLNFTGIINRIIRIVTSSYKESSKTSCDIYMEPLEINQFTTFDTKKIEAIFDFGYNYAQNFKDEFLKIKTSKI